MSDITNKPNVIQHFQIIFCNNADAIKELPATLTITLRIINL
jgi:hypothetical protein